MVGKPDSEKQRRWDAKQAKKARAKAFRKQYRWQIWIVAAVITAILLAFGAFSRNNGAEGSTPIESQSCAQLSKTESRIFAEQQPDSGASTDTLRQDSIDAQRLNDRVDALGGCPTYPNLQ